MMRRMDYLLRQIHLESSQRRGDIAEVIYLRMHIRIPLSAFRVVRRLRFGAARVSDLAAELRESLPTVTRLVQQLEAQGLIIRTPDETDGRASIVQLSPRGVELEQTIHGETLDNISRWLKDWSDSQLGELLPLLERLAADYTGHVGFTEPWGEQFEDELVRTDESV